MTSPSADGDLDIEIDVGSDAASVSSTKDSPRINEAQSAVSECKDQGSKIKCRLETKDLWDKFHDLGTEMIITKTGR